MRIVMVLGLVWSLSALAAGENVTLYRDKFGVPNIFAETPAGGAYALGYAQAEDRLEDIYKNIRTAIGTMAEFFGPDHVEIDYAMRLARNAELCEENYSSGPPEMRAMAEAYIAGINKYVSEHPERVPEYALDLQPWHCAAIGRAMVLRWPLGTLMDDLGKKPENPQFSSNCFAVAPSRSAMGCPILLTDPHLTWEGLAVFHEARVHAGPIEMCGFWIVGTPMLGLGHNGYVGWAMTTGGPDTSDVYMLKFKMGFPPQYEYEGQMLIPRMKGFEIKVKGEDKPRKMPALYTIHGPLLSEPDAEKGVAYAGKTPYLEAVDNFDQTWKMMTARDAEEFYAALKINALMEQNVMYADRKGNIGYVRVGKCPIRPEGYDWTRPVPGHTKATEWLGLYDLDEHVRVLNPASGYMQNCNISPENMWIGSDLTPERYNRHVYNVSWDFDNPRGKRMRELLAADDAITREEAMAIAMDVYDLLAKPWQEALRAALVAAEPLSAEAQQAADLVLAWDGTFTRHSAAAPLVRLWRLKAQDHVDLQAIAEGRALSGSDKAALLRYLAEARAEIQRVYGKFPVVWGECFVVGRNNEYFPYDGADFGRKPWNFTETVRDVEAEEQPKGSGRHVANSGSMAAMLMFFHEDGIESYTCTPWGASNQPDSPHHNDQARELYSKRQFKRVWWTREELLPNVESEKVLTWP